MSNTFKKPNSQVSTWHPSTNKITPTQNQSIYNPYGLRLRQTITSSGSVTIPAGIDWVYVVMAGAGGAEYFSYGGATGEVVWGWTLAQNTCIIGAGGAVIGGYTRYGHIIAKGGVSSTANPSANYYGIPGGAGFGDNTGTSGLPGSNGGGGGGASTAQLVGGNGGDGISGGRGGRSDSSGASSTGGNGGSGLAGGGGGLGGGTSTGTHTGGNGGNGIGVDGTIYTGGTGTTGTNVSRGGGGGAGIAGNGGNASGGTGGLGGLGGGGAGAGGNNLSGGNGILYIYY